MKYCVKTLGGVLARHCADSHGKRINATEDSVYDNNCRNLYSQNLPRICHSCLFDRFVINVHEHKNMLNLTLVWSAHGEKWICFYYSKSEIKE